MRRSPGKAKYAEDYRAEGMLFCKLLLSPMPHARVRRIDASRALAMPGVRAILTADDVPAPADSITDNGTVIKANKWTERGLTMEPLYQGEPILAVAAVDELTAADAIENDPHRLRAAAVRRSIRSTRCARADRTREPTATSGSRVSSSAAGRRAQVDRRGLRRGQAKAACRWARRPTNGRTAISTPASANAALVLDETFVTPDTSHQTLETRSAMAYWQNGKVYVHTGTQSTAQTVPAIARWLHLDPDKVVFISEYTGGGFGSKITGGISMIIPALLSKKANAPVMMRITREEEHFIGRARPGFSGPDEGRLLHRRAGSRRSTCS